MGIANDCLQWAVSIALQPRQGEQTIQMKEDGAPPFEISDPRDIIAWYNDAIQEARELTGVSPILVEPEQEQHTTDNKQDESDSNRT